MKKTIDESQKTQNDNESLNQSTPEALKDIFTQNNIFTQNIPKSEDCLNWIKCDSFKHCADVSFSRPMKNIEFEKIDNVGQWFAYYNVQLPTIIIEKQNLKNDSNILLMAVQIIQLNGKIEKVSELAGENTIQNKPDQRIEFKGLKLNTPQKIQNKKKCLHHIAVCVFQFDPLNPNNDRKLIGLSISGGFSLKSRKKSHQEKTPTVDAINLENYLSQTILYPCNHPFTYFQTKLQQGLDTSFFKPLDLTQNLHQRKVKQQPVSITNDFEGLQLYFTSPNIRHKIIHPLFLSIRFSDTVKLYLCGQTFPFEDNQTILLRYVIPSHPYQPFFQKQLISQVKKICTEFSSPAQVSKKKKIQPIIIVIDSTTPQQDLSEEQQKRKKQSLEKINKAIECAKNSKCQYIVGNEEFNIDDYPNHYHFETQENKDDIVNAYKSICQSNFGGNDCSWLNQEQSSRESSENNSSVSSEKRSNNKQLRSIIDVNKCRRENKNSIQLYRVQVYSEDTQSHHENQKALPISNEENQGNTEDMLSQANFSFQKESQRTIISEKFEDCKQKENFNQVQIRENTKDENLIPYKLENLSIQPKTLSSQSQQTQSPISPQKQNMNGISLPGDNTQIMNSSLQNLYDQTKQLQLIQQPQMNQHIFNVQNVLNICKQQQQAQFLNIPLQVSQNQQQQQQQSSQNGFYFTQNQISFPQQTINQLNQIPTQQQYILSLAQNSYLQAFQKTLPQLQESNISNVLKQNQKNNIQVINDMITQSQFLNQTLQQNLYKKD